VGALIGATTSSSIDQQRQRTSGDLAAALRRFLALPGTKSYLIHVGQGGSLRRIAHQPDLFLFTASAYKTFGVDLGWPGVLNPPGPLRSPLNNVITLAGNARDFVSWYEQALRGVFFAKRETLIEFKRIQAMSIQIAQAVPPDTPAYAKGGELPWPGLSTKSFAGQIVVGGAGRTPVTFCFIVNWNGPESDFPAVEAEFFAAIKGILRVIKRDLQ
jgi:hypothetical protein